jgi:hypothetical protein
VFQNIKDVKAEMARFALWHVYPKLAVFALNPPNCSANPKTSWNFDLIDPMVERFFAAQEGRSSILDFATQPHWMFHQDKPVVIPDDPNQVDWNYAGQGTQILDKTGKQLAEYFARIVSWYTQGGFTDECGVFHSSGHKYNISAWEVFNEIEFEHNYSIQDYTIQYDAITAAIRKVSPKTEFVGLALGNPVRDVNYVQYFLNASNHAPGTPLDWISYHYYAFIDTKTNVSQWADQIFGQSAFYVGNMETIEQARRQLSPNTKSTVNEFGVIINQAGMQPDPESIPDIYWNICAAQYGITFGRASVAGVQALGMSQMVGFPSQFPSVSMVDWNTGKGNARLSTLKMIVKHLAPNNGQRKLKIFATVTTDDVYGIGYLVTEKDGTVVKKSLIVNKGADFATIQVNTLNSGVVEYTDLQRTGPYGESKQEAVTGSAITLGGYGVAIVVYK